MTIAIPFDAKYADAAERLLKWCFELSGRTRHSCLLVCCKDTPPEDRLRVVNAAKEAFVTVNLITPGMKDQHKWPETVNLLFRTTCSYIAKEKREPFFWCEVDCVPLVSNWIDQLESEYYLQVRPYMGFRRDIPVPHISGPAVYPPNVAKYNPESLKDRRNRFGTIPFDTVDGMQTLKHAHVTHLIHHEWGEKDKPPTFLDQESLKQINEGAVVFHRCKDGSLIERLRESKWPYRVEINVMATIREMGKGSEIKLEPAHNSGILISCIYVYPVFGGKHDYLAQRFVESYTKHFPEIAHELHVVSNGGPPTEAMKKVFDNVNVNWVEHDDTGWDIGAYRKCAKEIPCDLMVFFGGTAFVLGRGWLERMVEAFKKHGPDNLYGATASHGGTSHIRTTGLWCDPKLLNKYPHKTTSEQSSRYAFEHGSDSFTQWVMKRGGKALMVTWTDEVEKEGWDLIPNGFHRGDQSALIVGDRLTLPPYHSAPEK